MKFSQLAGLVVVLASASTARAQLGADVCTTPDVLVGAGPFNFDNTAATTGTQGQTEAKCLAFGSTAISRDVWFTWTSTFTGFATVATCGGTAVDTKLATYAGSTCPTAGTVLVCNEDGCASFQSTTEPFAVTLGQNYVLQLGTYPGGGGSAGGTGTFTINSVVPPTNNSCGSPTTLIGPGTYPLDTTTATTGAEGQTESLCLFTASSSLYRDVWFAYTPGSNGTVTVSTCGLIPSGSSEDSRIAVYTGTACPAAGTATACNDDFACSGFSAFNATVSFPAVCGTNYLFQIGSYAPGATLSGAVSVAEVGGSVCATPVTYYCKGDGSGTACPCANTGAVGNGCANSLNANGGNLAGSGLASVSGDTWVLAGTGIPNGPGLYFQGTTQLGAGNGVVFGDGLRCVGGSVIRLGIVTAAGNASSYPSPNPPAVNAIPISLKGLITAGDIRNYQLWYRDSAAFCNPQVFNLTNGANTTWIP